MTGSRPAIAAALVLALGPARARAEADAAERETARALMAEGRADRDRGDLAGACRAFEAADALMHAPTTGLEMARTRAAMALLVEASDTALRVARIPEAADDPIPFKRARRAAQELYEELQKRIPSIVVLVTGAARSPVVTLDGVALAAPLLGHPRKLDPGHHVIEVNDGMHAGRREVDVVEKDATQVVLDLASMPSAPVTPGASPLGSQLPHGDDRSSTAAAEARPERTGMDKAMIYGGFVVAGTGVVAGTVTALLSISETHRIRNSGACNGNQCGPSQFERIESARSLAAFSTVAMIGAAAGAVVGVIGFLISPSDGRPPMSATSLRSIRIHPRAGLSGGGLEVRF